ncbi:NADAR family protein [Butyrivibrio sp. AE2032]|uniref:NADAR family protein n=1 Tax=Butyrivibrio sp. AE2032 TaxID=1458463 RepID=UPI0005588FE7|nr:NADAR family protein [Butyrivibrio sp. AE2032]
MDEVSVINEFKGENRFLSNFYACDFEFEGLTYHSAEAAFQAQKCSTEERKVIYAAVTNPVVAKRMGKKEPNLPANWNEISCGIMKRVLTAKFSVPELREKLKATGDATLIEGNKHHDNLWGKCMCNGCSNKTAQNRLGTILMEIRSEL